VRAAANHGQQIHVVRVVVGQVRDWSECRLARLVGTQEQRHGAVQKITDDIIRRIRVLAERTPDNDPEKPDLLFRVAELYAALASTGLPHRLLYALKANRFTPLVELLRGEGVGIDASSPREIAFALELGFAPADISLTASMLSNRDLAEIAGHGVHVNLDTHSLLRRWAATSGPRNVGLRVDPAVRVGWGADPKLSYGDSKFGFAAGEAVAAARYAESLGLIVDTLHCHAGWGLQMSAAPLLRLAWRQIAELARSIPTVTTINVGGGLCARHRVEDEPLDLASWAALLRDELGRTNCTIVCEPGTFVVASAGALVCEVNTVEPRASGTWLGIDAGHNVNVYVAHYGIPLAIIPVARPLAPPTQTVHLAGNINEANDVFARELPLPDLAEGDLVALFPAGAYGSSMASDHCLRGPAREVLA